MARQMCAMLSTMCGGLGGCLFADKDIQIPPTMTGIRYQARKRESWIEWKMVAKRNSRMKMMAPTRLGM